MTRGATSRVIPNEPVRLVLLVVSACASLIALSACGGADPAEVKAAAETFTASDGPLAVPLEKDQAECRIEVFLESDLSDEAIAAIKSGGPPAPKTEDDIEVMRELADELATKCLVPED